MSSETELYEKAKNRRYCGFAKNLLKILLFLLGFIALFILALTETSKAKTISVRGSVTAPEDQRTGETVEELSEKQKKKKDEYLLRAAETLEYAEHDVGEAEEEALEQVEDVLEQALQSVEVTLKKTLGHLLMDKGYSTDKVKDVEDEVIGRLEDKVKEDLKTQADGIKYDAWEDMETVFENDKELKLDEKEIENDVGVMRDYFVGETKQNIKLAEEMIEKKIRDFTSQIEKEVISEKLGEQTTEKELEETELTVKASDIASKIDENERKELSRIEDNIAERTSEIEKNIQNILQEFLLNKKGMTSSEATSVNEEVSQQLKKEMDLNVQKKTEDLKQEVKETAAIEVDTLIEEDKFVIDQAKKLGLTDSDSQKDVDMIEKHLARLENDFDGYTKDLTAFITKDLLNSIEEIVKKVEKEVLEKKGITITQEELDNLVSEELGKTLNNLD